MITETFKPLTDDLCFKYVFSKKIILEDFINSFLDFVNYNYLFEFLSIVPEKIIMPNNKEYKLYYGDIIGTLNNDNIISLEMYKDSFNKEKYNKSFAYMNRLFDKNIAKNGYKNANKVYSINLIKGNFRRINNELVNNYIFCNKNNHKIIDSGNTEMFLIRFDKVKEIAYNKNEKRFITWLRIISAESFEELKKYGKEDKIMTEVQKFVAEWCKESSKRNFEEYIAEKEREVERKAERKIKKAKKDVIIETAKNMIIDNVELSIIEKYTGLSQSELNRLKAKF